MNKSLLLAAAALGVFSACSENIDTTPPPAVGVINVSVIPDGSAISYDNFVIGDTIVNTNDSVRYNVTPEALQNALVKVKPTLFGEAYYNNERILEDGVLMDVTQPVRLEARSGGLVTRYVLKVVQHQIQTIPPMEKLASRFAGFPDPKLMIDYDVAYFKDKFYATVTSYKPGTENGATVADRRINYELYTSEDGLTWEQVVYKTNTDGVRLPRGQKEYVVGGEGASLVVFNDRLYVLGGARTKGKDRFGNSPELQYEMPTVKNWRAFSTPDGETFYCDTVGKSLNMMDNELPSTAINQLMNIFGTVPVAFKDKLYMFSAQKILYGGTYQPGTYIYHSEDGKRWIAPTPITLSDGVAVASIADAAYFVFKDKMWCVGGFMNYAESGRFPNSIYSTEDGVNWTLEGTLPVELLGNVYGLRAVATENVVYLFGGQKYPMYEGEVVGFAPNQVLRSTDAINWEVVETPENFTPVRCGKVVGVGDKAWLFGGVSSIATDKYPYPTSADTRSTEIWTQSLK